MTHTKVLVCGVGKLSAKIACGRLAPVPCAEKYVKLKMLGRGDVGKVYLVEAKVRELSAVSI